MYSQFNNRPQAPFSLSARIAFKSTVRGISADMPHQSLANYLKTLENAKFQEQYDAARGVVRAWEETLPAQMRRIATQLSTLVDQKWFASAHVPALLKVCEKIGYFARAHENYDAINIVREALRRNSWHTEVLLYVFDKGVAQAARMPAEKSKPATLKVVVGA